MDLNFPKGFLWGTATAAYQTEGNNLNSDWRSIEEAIEYEISQTNGIDHYNLYDSDFTFAKELGLNAQRLSLEWSRVEPENGKFDRKEIEHYREVLKYLKNNNYKVVLTLHHFSNPVWFEELGGWKEQNISSNIFIRYVTLCLEEFGELVDYFLTFNEPNLYAGFYPLKHYYKERIVSANRYIGNIRSLMKTHVKSYELIKKYRKSTQVGFCLNLPYIEPYSKSILDVLAAKLINNIGLEYFSSYIRNYSDFLGLNYYFHLKAKANLFNPDRFIVLYDGNAERVRYGVKGIKVNIDLSNINVGEVYSDLGWEIYPKGIYEVLVELRKFGKPIIITENGIDDTDDLKRAKFIKDHLFFVWKAINEGVDVGGYFYWSLMDNFEWFEGYKPNFGLAEVNHKTKERVVRASAQEFAKICKFNKLEADPLPTLNNKQNRNV